MRVNRERLRKTKYSKRLAKKIKEDPNEYKASIEDLKKTKKLMADLCKKGMDDEIIHSAVVVSESAFYEALATGMKRKDIEFFEKHVDRIKDKYKKALDQKKKRQKRNNKDKLMTELDELDKLFSE